MRGRGFRASPDQKVCLFESTPSAHLYAPDGRSRAESAGTAYRPAQATGAWTARPWPDDGSPGWPAGAENARDRAPSPSVFRPGVRTPIGVRSLSQVIDVAAIGIARRVNLRIRLHSNQGHPRSLTTTERLRVSPDYAGIDVAEGKDRQCSPGCYGDTRG